ncbi:MAG: histidine phosphatase family protein [Fusobacteriaceae bacterium]
MNIFFVRHGQTEWNELGKFQGSKDSSLTSVGISQAKKLNLKFEQDNLKFEKIYASPLGRAFNTAKIIINEKYPVLPLEEFKEISVGEMEGIPFTKFQELFPNEYYNFFNCPQNYNPCNIKGETFSALMDRIEMGLKKIVASNSINSNILVVTHGVTLKAICSFIKNNSKNLEVFAHEEIPQNTSVTQVMFDGENFKIVDFSNTSHLD